MEFPPSSAAQRISSSSGTVRVTIDQDDQGGVRLRRYEGVLPGFTSAGTTSVTIDLVSGQITGLVLTPTQDPRDLNAMYPDLSVQVQDSGRRIHLTASTGPQRHEYTLELPDLTLGTHDVASTNRLETAVEVHRIIDLEENQTLDETASGDMRADRVAENEVPRVLPLPLPPISVEIGPDQTIESGEGAALIPEVIGGVGELQIAWTPEVGLTDAEWEHPLAFPTSTTTYTLTVTDARGQRATDSVTITVVSPGNGDDGNDTAKLNVTLTAHPASIGLGESAELNAIITGGVPPFQCDWSGGEPTLATSPTITVSPERTTTYSVTVLDAGYPVQWATTELTIIVEAEPLAQIEHQFSQSPSGGADIATVEDHDDIVQTVTIPPGLNHADVQFALVQPSGAIWGEAPAPNVVVDAQGTATIRHEVPVSSLPSTGQWATLATYGDEVVDFRFVRVERSPAESSDLLIVNSSDTSPLLAVTADATGRVSYWLGRRLSGGIPGRIEACLQVDPDGSWMTRRYDEYHNVTSMRVAEDRVLTWTPSSGGNEVILSSWVSGANEGNWTLPITAPAAPKREPMGASKAGAEDVGNRVFHAPLLELLGYSGATEAMAEAELEALMTAAPSVVVTTPSCLRDLSNLIVRDAYHVPSFAYEFAGSYGYNTAAAKRDIAALNAELTAAVRGWSNYVIDQSFRIGWGFNPLTDSKLEIALGFGGKWVVGPMLNALALHGLGKGLKLAVKAIGFNVLTKVGISETQARIWTAKLTDQVNTITFWKSIVDQLAGIVPERTKAEVAEAFHSSVTSSAGSWKSSIQHLLDASLAGRHTGPCGYLRDEIEFLEDRLEGRDCWAGQHDCIEACGYREWPNAISELACHNDCKDARRACEEPEASQIEAKEEELDRCEEAHQDPMMQ